MSDALKIGVLISGSGTNLQAIIDAIAHDGLNVQIVKVLSSRPDAYGLERARAAGIPTVALDRSVYADAAAADARIAREFVEAGAQYLVMAFTRPFCPPSRGRTPFATPSISASRSRV